MALVSGAGAADGIGIAIARRLGQAGARLAISASSARIHERVAELRTRSLAPQSSRYTTSTASWRPRSSRTTV